MGEGVLPYTFEYSLIKDGHIILNVPDGPFSASDYVTLAFYDYSSASFNDSFRLVGVDKTRRYFNIIDIARR
jgi:hypothetical protein